MIYTPENIPARGNIYVRGVELKWVTEFDTESREITFIPNPKILKKGDDGEPDFITVKFTARDEDSCVFVSNDGNYTIDF